VETPETYLGAERGTYSQKIHVGQAFDYTPEPKPFLNQVELEGIWRIEAQKLIAGPGAHLLFQYTAPRIYVVAAPPAASPGRIAATVDGKAQPAMIVPHDDLYQVIQLARAGPHKLDLAVRSGTSLYSFTFG
jgi:hypothetical protein